MPQGPYDIYQPGTGIIYSLDTSGDLTLAGKITASNYTAGNASGTYTGMAVTGTSGTVFVTSSTTGTAVIAGPLEVGGQFNSNGLTAIANVYLAGTIGYQAAGAGINSGAIATSQTGTAVSLAGNALLAVGTGGTQLADLTRDYMVYLNCTTLGSATITIGGTQASGGGTATVYQGSAAVGQCVTYRCPGGWFTWIKGGTVAFANQNIVSC